MQYQPIPRANMAAANYKDWSIEELWRLAAQMRVPGARTKSRRELIDLFAVPAPARR
jgi:hypothetical protein